MGYRFPATQKTRKIKSAYSLPTPILEPETIGKIQDQTPGSREEWRVAVALYRLKYTFIYQFPVFGGKVSGGQVIDFWITNTHLPTPVYMNGRAWHNNKTATVDEYKIYKLKKLFHGLIREPVIIWDDEVPSIPAATSLLRRKL